MNKLSGISCSVIGAVKNCLPSEKIIRQHRVRKDGDFVSI